MDAVPDTVSEGECSVCYEPFKEPKLLLCGHLVCRSCLLSWIRTSQQDAWCPLCRHPIADTRDFNGDEVLEAIVESLPTDLAMKNVGEAECILRKEHICLTCKYAAASTMCLTCRATLCPACTHLHQTSAVSKDHRVETIASVTAEQLASSRSSMCHSHTGRRAEMFCASHNAILCQTCAVADHSQCTGIVDLDTKIQETQTELEELTAALSRGKSETDEAMKQLDERFNESDTCLTDDLKEAERAYDRMDELLMTFGDHITKLTKKGFIDHRKLANEEKKKLVMHKGRLTIHKRALARAGELGEYSELRDMTLAMKTRVGEIICGAVLAPTDEEAFAPRMLVFDTEAVARAEQSLQQLIESVKLAVPFTFHCNHGEDIVLTGAARMAEKKGGIHYGGILMARQPMEVNHLYEIQVKSLSKEMGGSTMLLLPGVVTSSPGSLTLPPSQDALAWNRATVTGIFCVNDRGTKTQSSLGAQLTHLKKGSRVGVSVDEERQLLVHRDGVCLGVVASPVPLPAYALFDLRHSVNYTITSLPITCLV